MQALTDKQKDILSFLQSFTKMSGYPPTVKEIMDKFNFASPTAVTTHLIALEKKGYIKKTGNRARGAVPIGIKTIDSDDLVRVNLLGNEVKAGLSMAVSSEDIEASYILPRSIAGEDSFLMKVVGDSMIEEHIKENDMLLIKHSDIANDGDIVVAVYENESGDEEITVKKFFREKKHITLMPANKHYKPIIAESIRIVGKVIGIIRLDV